MWMEMPAILSRPNTWETQTSHPLKGTCVKTNSKGIKDTNVGVETKFLEEHTGVNSCDLGWSNDCFYVTPKVPVTK